MGMSYGHLLMDAIRDGHFEIFRGLFPLLEFEEDNPYDIYLMVECVDYERMEFVEFMMSVGFETERFIDEVLELVEILVCPELVIELLDWVSGRDATVEEQRLDIYGDALDKLLRNGQITNDNREELVRELIEKGVVVNDRTLSAYEEAYPDNPEFLEILRNAQIPTIKEPE